MKNSFRNIEVGEKRRTAAQGDEREREKKTRKKIITIISFVVSFVLL